MKLGAKSGFSLVELTLAITIIGLLIAAITIGQSLVGSSKVTTTISQLSQFDSEVVNFKNIYDALPGDSAKFSGDSDGVIDMTAASTQDDKVTTFTCEIGNFWNNLLEDYTGGDCSINGRKAISAGSSKNVPPAKLGDSGSFYIASALSADGSSANKVTAQNYYAILHKTQLQSPISGAYSLATTTAANSAVRPADLLALDSKIDDTSPTTGSVISGAVANAGGNIGGIVATPLAACSGAAYQATTKEPVCTPLIRIGLTEKQLQ